MTPRTSHLQPVGTDDLPEYPFSEEDRLNSHYFMTWERRRWLTCDMRLNATPECRALYFDLINIAYDNAPIGTLPDNLDSLAKLVMVDASHFKALCQLEYGPLHNWKPCLCDSGQVRLMHPFVVKSLADAMSRKEDNRAKNDAANAVKRRQRLRGAIAGYHVDLAKNDAAVLFIDEWLQKEGCEYRSSSWIERGIAQWSEHMLTLGLHRRGTMG